ncbi:hypothetical protein [Methylomonas fluvii]|uniref:Uncharacterized protein n=1 Tax=Methylomonas fluvii TaxID=1854564 RepID=A0ABR9DJ56_9GAMM|nr:hypothetical protein [Methylomonas fluvii]MBD9362901.1 hypothetical protein [Methylomonas fluvii]CAD6876086.1 hypothetical protein [Methylomonas fluvii]
MLKEELNQLLGQWKLRAKKRLDCAKLEEDGEKRLAIERTAFCYANAALELEALITRVEADQC